LSFPLRTTWLLAFLALFAASCNDSIVCVFTTGCQGPSGRLSDNPAVPPVDGEWIIDGPPDVVPSGVFPKGTTNPPTTPVVVLFDETMAPDSMEGAIEVVPSLGGFPGPAVDVEQTLLGDGRVLLLLPASDLAAGDYLVQVGAESNATDLTGQAFVKVPGTQLGTFTVSATPPAEPRLVATYPQDGDTGQSETGQMVVVFDRAIDPGSVDGASFDVKVDDLDPPLDPQPRAVTVGGGPEDTRAFVYRSVNAAGTPVPLGNDVEVTIALSPVGNPLLDDEEGEVLAPVTITFQTLDLAAPLGASLLSDPTDAIGLANLTDNSPEELTVEVELEDGKPDDFVDLFVFGEERTEEPEPIVIALQRFIRLAGTEPILTATFTREDVGLQLSDDPANVHFADGPLAFAFRLRRAGIVTPVKLLDLDPDPARLQDVILDTHAPTLRALLVPGGTTDEFRSDQRGISIAGRVLVTPTEPETVRSVEVTTDVGNNGTLPPVIGSDETGLFLAAPVPAGILDPSTVNFSSIVVYDAALNAAPAVSGTVTQLGVVGPGALAPGDDVTVQVFDGRTLAPVPGATVLVHADHGNGVDFPQIAQGQTLADGTVTLATEGAPSIGAIVTVVAQSYDLFTFHGVPSAHLSVPLFQSNRGVGRVDGDVFSTNAAAVALLPGLDRRLDDSRRTFEQPRGFVSGSCPPPSGGELTCPYGPEGVQDSQLGARSFFAGDFTQTEGNFSPALLLQAFALEVPFDRIQPNQLQPGDFTVPFLLTDGATPPEEAAIGLPPVVFQVDPGSGVGVLASDPDPTTTGNPFVTVEVLIPGIPGSLAVSTGLSFDQGGDRWVVRTAQPGAVTAGGPLGSVGIVDDDPFVRMELRDSESNAAGARPRLSTILAGGPLPVFHALAVPRVLSPLLGASTGGQPFNVVLSHAIGDERAAGGLYRVRLRDDAGRSWTLWRVDPTGSGDVLLRVPVANVLASKELVIDSAAYAWSGFSPIGFLWSDVEREVELFSFGEPFTIVNH